MSIYEYDELFLPQEQLREFCETTETPFFLYHADVLRERARQVCDAFSFCRFRPFFPMRALPNPHVLRILREQGYGVVCSSMEEQRMAKTFGYSAEETVFLAHCCTQLPFGDAQLILEEFSQLELLPERLSGVIGLRYHPGGKISAGPTAVFGSKRLQFGAEEAELTQMADNLIARGCDGIGLHCQVGRNCDSPAYYPAIAKQLFELAVRLDAQGISVHYCDLGGGIGYQSYCGAETPDMMQIAAEIEKLYQRILVPAGLGNMELRSQIGRWIAAPAGIFIARVVSARMRSAQLLGVDATAMLLPQTMLYNSYYHVSILGKNQAEERCYTDIIGCSQERKDRLAEKRLLPVAEVGDLCVFHDIGAYGMGCHINEYLIMDGDVLIIRRKHTEPAWLETLMPL